MNIAVAMRRVMDVYSPLLYPHAGLHGCGYQHLYYAPLNGLRVRGLRGLFEHLRDKCNHLLFFLWIALGDEKRECGERRRIYVPTALASSLS